MTKVIDWQYLAEEKDKELRKNARILRETQKQLHVERERADSERDFKVAYKKECEELRKLIARAYHAFYKPEWREGECMNEVTPDLFEAAEEYIDKKQTVEDVIGEWSEPNDAA